MCLYFDQKLTKTYKTSKKSIKAFKVFRVSSFHSVLGEVRYDISSPYKEFNFIKAGSQYSHMWEDDNKWIPTRKTLSPLEKYSDAIRYGFHFFLKRKDAKNLSIKRNREYKDSGHYFVVLDFELDPKTVRAAGGFPDPSGVPNICVTKFTMTQEDRDKAIKSAKRGLSKRRRQQRTLTV